MRGATRAAPPAAPGGPGASRGSDGCRRRRPGAGWCPGPSGPRRRRRTRRRRCWPSRAATLTCSPLPIGHPPSSTSPVATRATPITGVSQRSSSSTTAGIDRMGRRRAVGAARGARRGSAKKQSSDAVTVSSPAMRNRKQMSRISSRLAVAVDLGGEELAQQVVAVGSGCARWSSTPSK